jgi:hypothetical protein
VAFSHQQVANMMMRRRSFSRNSLDVRDRVQVRVVRKRLKLTDAQLGDIIRKSGNSISAISKEAGARQCLSLPKHTTSAAVIAASEPDATVMQAEAV